MILMLIDGNSILNRAFYGIRLLTTSDGLYTNAVYGFLTILKKLLDEESPDALCVAFDLPEPTFRHKQYDAYKAGRRAMPEELAVQLPVIKQVLDAMNLRRCELPGWEADDLIGTLAARSEASGWNCLIITGDKDSFQLISEYTGVLHVKTKGGNTETTRYDTAKFTEEYGFPPSAMTDLKALMGDQSDNVPGVKGIGEKTALELIRRFGSVEEIYSQLDCPDIKPTVKKKLNEGREAAGISRQLVTIDSSAPLDITPQDCILGKPDSAALLSLFRRLEFYRLIDKWGLRETQVIPGPSPAASDFIVPATKQEIDALGEVLRKDTLVSLLALPGLAGVCLDCSAGTYFLLHDTLGDDYDYALRVLFSSDVKKTTHDLKRLCADLLAEGLSADGFVFDTVLAAYLLSPTDGSYLLERLASSYIDRALEPENTYLSADALSRLGDREKAMSVWGSHTRAVSALTESLYHKLEQLGMTSLLLDIELPLCEVLTSMEKQGFLIDKKALQDFGEKLSVRIAELESSIYGDAGGPFNINSTKQLGTVLFDTLMLPTYKKTKSGYSTGIDVLERLAGKHPIIEKLIEYRKLTKLKSTYADGLLKVIAPDGRIHTSFTMTVTATGRLSSTEPNLQNIPVRTELGSEIRKMFVAAPGNVLIDADYSQIELRLLAHISGDAIMKSAFESGADIHTQTASQVFGVPPEKVTPHMRSSSKAVNFGIVYGISDYSLSQDIGVSVAEARKYMESYFEHYSGVRAYMKDIVARAKADGYVTTLMGRRRNIPELKSTDYNTRSFGERVALNTPIQGSAADIIKLAMVNVSKALKNSGLKAKLIMQVHDELIAEAPTEEAETVLGILKREMQSAVTLSVPLIADAKCGSSWYDAK